MIYDPECFNDLRTGKHKILLMICHCDDYKAKMTHRWGKSSYNRHVNRTKREKQSCGMKLIVVRFIIKRALQHFYGSNDSLACTL